MAVVLITGGSSGIGLATVRRLAASGHRVFYASRGAAEDVPPGEVRHIGLDLANPGACDAELHGTGISVTVIAPGLFRTSMPEQFRDSRVNEGSPYAKAFAAIRNGNGAIMERAGDPDQVARAIEDCMGASAPPVRIVVGADAVEMEEEARRSSPQEYADLLRDYVAGLSA